MNEMKSEYVVFCTSCGQKLENNFTNWQRRNPGGTFDEYKQDACFAENQLPPKLPAKKNRPLKQKILIVDDDNNIVYEEDEITKEISIFFKIESYGFFPHKQFMKMNIEHELSNRK